MNDHPNKHVREAVDYALANGWRLAKAGARAHVGEGYSVGRKRGAVVLLLSTAPHESRKTMLNIFDGALTLVLTDDSGAIE